ncbi:Linoleate 10R-lipoxygenase [Hypsizygus marmoreus]|uniref:Linoleate 10R-lipoxygenase n=1 Tax=Hypsizygus marmoreus TaxID=39966 RepID=A0A369JI09_HYPMA|nr:Linoleate 10R-lipoxygenase [Hypsizygus marmoreus]
MSSVKRSLSLSIFHKDSLPNATVLNGSASLKEKGAAAGTPQVIRDFREQIKKGLPISLDPSTLSSIVDGIRHTESLDDRKFFLEHALTFVSRLDEGPFATKIQNKIVEILYNDLGHPPATSIGNAYAWRTADGSYNNIDLPNMGKAGTPYARSVQQSHPLPKNQLPDPGLIFDTLLKREGFVKHPAGLSSLMFSFAALVIHSVFRTSHHDVNINETSSYVDLSPLYGHNKEAQHQVRVRDGYGRLHPDVFAEDRLLLLPPAVCALLVLFNRNHNYIAKKLLEINERGNYVNPATLKTDNPAAKDKLLAQEEELFQVARLINCGWFASVVFSDYFSCILGLVREGSSWSLNPFSEIRMDDHSVFERGKGNICSVEFNCLYRWHATTSVEDEKWVEEVFAEKFEGKSPDEVTIEDFKNAAHRIAAEQPDIVNWTFGRLQRQADGTFKDKDLADILQNATENPAAAFRARGTPASMRLHEIMGIEQNRRWGVCSLNDFRSYLGLKPYKSFKEWNPDPEIADAAEKLYGDINYLELYVGLQAEDAKPVIDGAGLCPGYTISRAILSDAIALTRGDRFFTYDYTPFNLTAWGFADCQRDPSAFGFGSTLGRLFLRTLPNNYTENSVYTFFPFMTPDSMKTHLTKLKVVDQYDLSRPGSNTAVTTVNGYAQVGEILSSKDAFISPYAARAARVIPGKGFYTAEGPEAQEKVYKALADSPESIEKIGRFFYDTTRKLIDASSFALVGKKTHGVDLVRDVLKLVPVCWAASDIAGIALKTKEHPHGHYTPQELYDILGDIYSFIFLDIEAAKVMVLGAKVSTHVRGLLGHIKGHLHGHGGKRNSIAGIVGSVSTLFDKPKKAEQHELIKRLSLIGNSSDELANTVLALLVGSAVELSIALTNMVNLYLGSEQDAAIRGIVKGADSKAKLDGFVSEALRLDPPLQGVYRTAAKEHTVGTLSIKKGDRVFLNVAGANLDASVFPAPKAVDASRGTKVILHGDGSINHLGEEVTVKILSEVLHAIYGYENVRRAPGQSGVLKRFKDHARPDLRFAYLDGNQFTSAWPTSLSIQYDDKSASK